MIRVIVYLLIIINIKRFNYTYLVNYFMNNVKRHPNIKI